MKTAKEETKENLFNHEIAFDILLENKIIIWSRMGGIRNEPAGDPAGEKLSIGGKGIGTLFVLA